MTGTTKEIVNYLTDQDDSKTWELTEKRKKRSLDANAYYYVLLSLMAEKLNTSVNEVHNETLSRYGYPETVDGNLITITLKKEADPNKLEGVHLKSTGHVTVNSKGIEFIDYLLMRGSHTFDTKEMCHLIDGVISEAKELGIDTITPSEKERMIALYEKHHTKK